MNGQDLVNFLVRGIAKADKERNRTWLIINIPNEVYEDDQLFKLRLQMAEVALKRANLKYRMEHLVLERKENDVCVVLKWRD